MMFQQSSGLTLKDLELLLAAVRENKAINYVRAINDIAKSRAVNALIGSIDGVQFMCKQHDTDRDHSAGLIVCALEHIAQVRTNPNSAFNLIQQSHREYFNDKLLKLGDRESFSEIDNNEVASDSIVVSYFNHGLSYRNSEVLFKMDRHNRYADLFKHVKHLVSTFDEERLSMASGTSQIQYGPINMYSKFDMILRDNVFERIAGKIQVTETNAKTGDKIEATYELVLNADVIECDTTYRITAN